MKTLKTFLLVLTLLSIAATAAAQSSGRQDDEDVQSWNEIQLTAPMTKKLDFFVGLTGRIGNNVKRFNEGRIGAGYVWKPTKSLSISPFYLYIRARNSALRFRTEHRLHLSGSYKFPIKSFGLTHRSLYEYRLRSGGNSWRYRPSLKFEKELPKKLLSDAKWFVMEEPFYVSATGKWSRNRFSVGVSKTVNKNVSVDVYYLRQNDGYSHPGDLNVIGTSWKVKM